MAIAHAQSMTNHLSASLQTSVVAKACNDALKAKPLSVVPKAAAPTQVEITPVFVGIAG